MLRNLRYFAEAVGLIIVMGGFRLLPLDASSSLGGIIARMFGPLSRAHKTAQQNLEAALPQLTEHERKRILSEMWDNIGRVFGEYPHLSLDTMRPRITIEGMEYLQDIKDSGKSAIFVSGHFANWELAPLSAALSGMPLIVLYRAANNPFTDWLISEIRSHYCRSSHKKGREGATATLKALRDGISVGMLIDQKMNDGKPVEFFGRPAMTATAAASLAIKMQVPLLPARVVRTDGAHFHVTLEAPRYYDRHASPEAAMLDLNRLYESWIRENPGQWFWVHRRWGK